MRYLQEQVKKAFRFKKLYVLYSIFSLFLLGFQPRILKAIFRSLVQFFLTVGQNSFGNKIPTIYHFDIDRNFNTIEYRRWYHGLYRIFNTIEYQKKIQSLTSIVPIIISNIFPHPEFNTKMKLSITTYIFTLCILYLEWVTDI